MPYARLDTVTDADPSLPTSPADLALTADDLLALTGGRLVVRSDRLVRAGSGGLPARHAGPAVRRPAG